MAKPSGYTAGLARVVAELTTAGQAGRTYLAVTEIAARSELSSSRTGDILRDLARIHVTERAPITVDDRTVTGHYLADPDAAAAYVAAAQDRDAKAKRMSGRASGSATGGEAG